MKKKRQPPQKRTQLRQKRWYQEEARMDFLTDWIGCGACSAEDMENNPDYYREEDGLNERFGDKVSEPDYEFLSLDDHLEKGFPADERSPVKKRVSWADEGRRGSLEISSDDPENFLFFDEKEKVKKASNKKTVLGAKDTTEESPPDTLLSIFAVATHLSSDTLGCIVARLQGMTKKVIQNKLVVDQIEIALGLPFYYDADFVPSSRLDLNDLVAFLRAISSATSITNKAILNEITASLEDLTIFEIADLLAPQLDMKHDTFVDALVEATNNEARLPPGFANPALRLCDVVHSLKTRRAIIRRALLSRELTSASR